MCGSDDGRPSLPPRFPARHAHCVYMAGVLPLSTSHRAHKPRWKKFSASELRSRPCRRRKRLRGRRSATRRFLTRYTAAVPGAGIAAVRPENRAGKQRWKPVRRRMRLKPVLFPAPRAGESAAMSPAPARRSRPTTGRRAHGSHCARSRGRGRRPTPRVQDARQTCGRART